MGDTSDVKKLFQETLNNVVKSGDELLVKNNTFHENVEKELQEIDDKLSQLKINFQSVLSQIGDLNSEKTNNDNIIADLNKKIANLNTENNTQKVAMDADIQQRNTEIKTLKAQLTSVETANAELKTSGDASKAEKEDIEAKRLEIEQRIETLQNDLDKKILENEELNKNEIEMIAKHQSEINDLKQQNENIDDLLKKAIEELKKIMVIIGELSKEKKYEKIDTIKGKIDELLVLVSPSDKYSDTKIDTSIDIGDVYRNNTDGVIQKPDNVIPKNIVKKGIERIEGDGDNDFPLASDFKTIEEIKFDDMKKIKESSFEEGEKILFTKNGIQKKGTVRNITLDPGNNKEFNYSVIDEKGNFTSGLTKDQLKKDSEQKGKDSEQEGGKKKTRKNKTAKRKKRVTKKKRGSNKKAKKFTQRKKR
jgi:hypothetical protein